MLDGGKLGNLEWVERDLYDGILLIDSDSVLNGWTDKYNLDSLLVQMMVW